MIEFLVLLTIILILLPLIGLIVAVRFRNRIKALEGENDFLRGSIDSLTKRVKKIESHAAPTPPPSASEAAPAVVQVETAERGTPPTPPPPEPKPDVSILAAPPVVTRPTPPTPVLPEPKSRSEPHPAEAKRGLDTWEVAIGGSWLNRIGVTLLVIGMAFALGYTLTHLGPLGKALLATVVSLLLILTGFLFERREVYAFYGRGLIAGGWAALYATAYAVHELPATRVIESPRIGFLLLLLVGTGMVLHSLRYRNQGLTGLAYALAYAAIVLHSISAYTLLAATLLGLGTVLHLLRRRWYGVALGGIAATYGSLFLWYLRQDPLTMEALGLGLGALAIDWCVFLVADFSPEPKERRDRDTARAVSILNGAAAAGLAYLAWDRAAAGETAWQPFLILGVLYIVTSGSLRRLGRPLTHRIHSVAAAVLLILATGEAFDRIGAIWAWLAIGLGPVLIGIRLRDRFHRMLGCVLFLVPTVAVLYDQLKARAALSNGAFDRDRFLLTAVACACFYFIFGRLRAFASPEPTSRVEESMRRGFSYAAFVLIVLASWVQLPRPYVAVASAAFMFLLFEISASRALPDLRVQCHLAACWAVLSALMFTAASTARIANLPVRVPALIAVAVALIGVFMRQAGNRRRVLHEDTSLRPLYSWSGVTMIALLIWLEARPVVVGPLWLILALVLVGAGIALNEAHLRRPGYAALLAAHASLVLSNLTATDVVAGWSIRVVTLVPAIAATYYLWWHLRSLSDRPASRALDLMDRRFGRLLSYLAVAMAGLFFRFEFGLDGAALRWSLAMIALFAAGYLLRDADLRLQAYALGLATSVRAIGFDFQQASPVLGVNGPLAVVIVGVVAYTATGFLIQHRADAGATRGPDRTRVELESSLESHGRDLMWLLGFLLAALYLYRTRSGSTLIVAWALEGLIATGGGFTFKSRPLRLAGLALLGIAIATTLMRAFTTFDTLGRIVSFLVLGVVLLLISLAYNRYRARMRKSQ